MKKKKIKKISVIRLRAYEIHYIKSVLEMYIEENIYTEDVTGLEIVKKIDTFVSERPCVFSRKRELGEGEEEESFYG